MAAQNAAIIRLAPLITSSPRSTVGVSLHDFVKNDNGRWKAPRGGPASGKAVRVFVVEVGSRPTSIGRLQPVPGRAPAAPNKSGPRRRPGCRSEPPCPLED